MIISCDAQALQCGPTSPEAVVSEYDVIFVAFITSAFFVEGEEVDDCGRIDGDFEVVEILKGNPAAVTVVRKLLLNCNGKRIGGASNDFPIGQHVLVTTNNEVANIGHCTMAWEHSEPSCFVDNIRRHLKLDAINLQQRELCAKPNGEISLPNRMRIVRDQLIDDREAINEQIKALEEEIEKAELMEISE